MMTVVVIGTIHGIFVMPAIFSACAHFSDWCRKYVFYGYGHKLRMIIRPSVGHTFVHEIKIIVLLVAVAHVLELPLWTSLLPPQ